jgi:hypothetical protein
LLINKAKLILYLYSSKVLNSGNDSATGNNIFCSVGTSTVGQGQIQKLVPVLQLKRIFQLYLLIYAIFHPLQASIVFQSKTILDFGSRRKWADL